MSANAGPALVAVVCAPSAPPALRDAAVAWVATLDPARVALLCDRVTVLAFIIGEAAIARGLKVMPYYYAGPTWCSKGIAGAVVFGLPQEAASARSAGVLVRREWDATGALVSVSS